MIVVKNLTKRYREVTAVDNISFEVKPGKIMGFVGPNGAGKSTTMRCLVGLTVPTSGETFILGQRYQDLPNPGAQVGTLLDASALHPGRTGIETLILGAILIGAPKKRAEEVLEIVGLTTKESRKRISTYSLGMRQRLGIAHAFLGSPKVLILDEPANGLDPQGIHWMRNFLRRYADAGNAVLLSSHLIHEIEQIADEILIIGKGRILAQGTAQDLMSDGTTLEDKFLELTSSASRGGLI